MPALGIDLCPPEFFIPPGQGPGSLVHKLADQEIDDAALVDADDLSWTLEPGSHVYRLVLFWTTGRRRDGLRLAMRFTGAALLTRYCVRDIPEAATSDGQEFAVRGVVVPAVNWLIIDGFLATAVPGDLKLQAVAENRPITLQAGSFGTLTQFGI